jgi:hypothetical protein
MCLQNSKACDEEICYLRYLSEKEDAEQCVKYADICVSKREGVLYVRGSWTYCLL